MARIGPNRFCNRCFPPHCPNRRLLRSITAVFERGSDEPTTLGCCLVRTRYQISTFLTNYLPFERLGRTSNFPLLLGPNTLPAISSLPSLYTSFPSLTPHTQIYPFHHLGTTFDGSRRNQPNQSGCLIRMPSFVIRGQHITTDHHTL
jgi:hypothetical protein